MTYGAGNSNTRHAQPPPPPSTPITTPLDPNAYISAAQSPAAMSPNQSLNSSADMTSSFENDSRSMSLGSIGPGSVSGVSQGSAPNHRGAHLQPHPITSSNGASPGSSMTSMTSLSGLFNQECTHRHNTIEECASTPPFSATSLLHFLPSPPFATTSAISLTCTPCCL